MKAKSQDSNRVDGHTIMTDTSLTQQAQAEEVILLKPTRGWSTLNLKDIWIYRELVYFLTWRDVIVRYKQTVLGAAWAIINPVINMVVLNLIFGTLGNLSTQGIPRPLFTFSALLPWGLFSKALNDAGRSMLSNRTMITKVYFPRMIIPLSSVLGGLVDFAIQFVVLLFMMYFYKYPLTRNMLTLPFFLILSLITALGVGLWLSALNVLYRDVNYILPFLTQFWLLLTPVGYAPNSFSVKLQVLNLLNPMSAVVVGFRWALVGTPPPSMLAITSSTIIALILLITGMYYFRRMERTFADMV
jgi:lipopolysaccharide transport system permease protein